MKIESLYAVGFWGRGPKYFYPQNTVINKSF